MSKDGYCGTGSLLLDIITLGEIIKLLESRGQPQAVQIVQEVYNAVRADIEKYLKISKVHG